MSTFTDLTSSWHYKDLIRWQYLHAHTVNDQVIWLGRGLVYYDNFENYYKTLKYGVEPDWDRDGTLDVPGTAINTENAKFGTGCLAVTADTECLLNASNRNNCKEGSLSFWIRGVGKSKKIWTTQWGMSLYTNKSGYLVFRIIDCEETTFDVIYATDITGKDWAHVVAIWRCKGDGSDLMTLYYNGVKV